MDRAGPWTRPCQGACPSCGVLGRLIWPSGPARAYQATTQDPSHCWSLRSSHARPVMMSSFIPLRYFCVMYLFAMHLSYIFFRAPFGLASTWCLSGFLLFRCYGKCYIHTSPGCKEARQQETIKRKRTLVNKWNTIDKAMNSEVLLGEVSWHHYNWNLSVMLPAGSPHGHPSQRPFQPPRCHQCTHLWCRWLWFFFYIHEFLFKNFLIVIQLLCRTMCFKIQNLDRWCAQSDVLNDDPKFRGRWSSFLPTSLRQHHSAARLFSRWCLPGGSKCSLSPCVFAGNAWNMTCLCTGTGFACPRHSGSMAVTVSTTSNSRDCNSV